MHHRLNPRVPIADGLWTDAADVSETSVRVKLMNMSTTGTAVAAAYTLGDVDDTFVIHLNFEGREITPLNCQIRYILGRRGKPWQGGADGNEPQWLHGAFFLDLTRAARDDINAFIELRIAALAALSPENQKRPEGRF